MKAVSPVRPSGRKAPSGCGGGELALRCLAEHGHSLGGSAAAAAAAAAARCKAAEAAADEPALCLQCDMNDCYSRLRRLVPTIPPNKKVSKVEILQHVIDYILDLQLALETHPALLRQPPPPAPPLHPAGASKWPDTHKKRCGQIAPGMHPLAFPSPHLPPRLLAELRAAGVV
ncbi:inhibitor of DNA binding 4 [Cricetulus griseus]